MPRFFVSDVAGGEAVLTGGDAAHIVRSLRMSAGDSLTLCDGAGADYACTIVSASPERVVLRAGPPSPSRGEPTVPVVLFQGLPKGEKMDWIVQKAVELGAAAVVPFLAARSVSRPDGPAALKKAQRWQKIADEAAKQSQRGRLPEVSAPVTFEEACRRARQTSRTVVLYEGGGEPLRRLLAPAPESLALFVGPEGGFEPQEVGALQAQGAAAATLGARILRTETAPLAALSAVMFATGNLE